MTSLNSNGFYILSKDDFEKTVQDITSKLISQVARKEDDTFLTKQEAAKFLRMSITTLDTNFREGYLPLSLRHQIGGMILFSKSELTEYVKKPKR